MLVEMVLTRQNQLILSATPKVESSKSNLMQRSR